MRLLLSAISAFYSFRKPVFLERAGEPCRFFCKRALRFLVETAENNAVLALSGDNSAATIVNSDTSADAGDGYTALQIG